MIDLSIYRYTDRLAINPYTFDAGNGPGIDTLSSILALARAANCGIDAGVSGGPIFLWNLPERDDDLIALLQMAQIIGA